MTRLSRIAEVTSLAAIGKQHFTPLHAVGGPPPPPIEFDWYVSPTGLPSNSGTIDSPWSLAHALAGANGFIGPGDTVALRGGTYVLVGTAFSVSGSVSAPVVFRPYPGEMPMVNGRWLHTGPYVWFWGFHLKNANFGPSAQDGAGISASAAGIKFIHLIVENFFGNGLDAFSAAPDTEFYGNTILNNGAWGSTDISFGHGLYTNVPAGGSRLIRANISFNQFGHGYQLFGSAASVHDITFDKNIGINNAYVNNNGSRGDLICYSGPVGSGTNIVIRENATWRVTPGDRFSAQIGPFGSSAEISEHQNLICEDNDFGGETRIYNWKTVSYQRNRVYGGNQFQMWQRFRWPGVPAYTWQDNEYWITNAFGYSHEYWIGASAVDTTFANWQSATGLDASGSSSTKNANGRPTSGTRVRVFAANAYEAGRAHIAIYNWASAATVDIPGAALSGILNNGDTYKVFNVQDDPTLVGAGIASGTYTGADVTVPMAGGLGPTPTVDANWVTRHGHSPAAPQTSGPLFNAFVLRKT